MPLSDGRAPRSLVQASKPPAEAPMPTTGKSSDLLEASGTSRPSPFEWRRPDLAPDSRSFSILLVPRFGISLQGLRVAPVSDASMIEINLRPGGGVTKSIRPAAYPPWARLAGEAKPFE